jgi:hypothetical protein
MSLRKLNYQNLLSSTASIGESGGHCVWVTDRWKYWIRDIEKHVPEDLQMNVHIASPEDMLEHGLPADTRIVLIDGKIKISGAFRLKYSEAGLSDSPLLEPIPTLDTDFIGGRPGYWSKPVVIDESELPY